jgi:hypothetical protein
MAWEWARDQKLEATSALAVSGVLAVLTVLRRVGSVASVTRSWAVWAVVGCHHSRLNGKMVVVWPAVVPFFSRYRLGWDRQVVWKKPVLMRFFQVFRRRGMLPRISGKPDFRRIQRDIWDK